MQDHHWWSSSWKRVLSYWGSGNRTTHLISVCFGVEICSLHVLSGIRLRHPAAWQTCGRKPNAPMRQREQRLICTNSHCGGRSAFLNKEEREMKLMMFFPRCNITTGFFQDCHPLKKTLRILKAWDKSYLKCKKKKEKEKKMQGTHCLEFVAVALHVWPHLFWH